MVKKHYYSWKDIERSCISIVNQMYADQWRPDYIVGITRGGNIPATIISNMTGIPCEAIKVSLRDDSKLESNTRMAMDAYGKFQQGQNRNEGKNILIVDDGSDKITKEIIFKLVSNHANIKSITHEKNLGRNHG